GSARDGRRADRGGGCDRCRQGARRLQPAATRLSGPEGQACRTARALRRRRGRDSRRPRAQAHQSAYGRPAGAAAARPARGGGRGVAGDPSDLRYDAKLAEAVKKYQRTNELKVTGALDVQTIRELNGPPRDRQIETIIANMERWRWYPRDMGKTRVVVNLPDF